MSAARGVSRRRRESCVARNRADRFGRWRGRWQRQELGLSRAGTNDPHFCSTRSIRADCGRALAALSAASGPKSQSPILVSPSPADLTSPGLDVARDRPLRPFHPLCDSAAPLPLSADGSRSIIHNQTGGGLSSYRPAAESTFAGLPIHDSAYSASYYSSIVIDFYLHLSV